MKYQAGTELLHCKHVFQLVSPVDMRGAGYFFAFYI